MNEPLAGADGQSSRRPLVHHGGRLVEPAAAALPMSSIAVRYGLSVFEGVRCYLGTDGRLRPWLLPDHLDRLHNSCRLMGLDASPVVAVPGIVDELIEANGVAEDCYVRIAVSAGNDGGIDQAAESVLTVSVTPSGRKRWLLTGAGMRLQISSWQRQSNAMFPTAAKNISAYAGPRLALVQAREAGFDNCVLRTVDGLIAEAPTATVFLVRDGRLITPRLADAVLPSITRAWVLTVAARLGLDAVEAAVSPDLLRGADEAFLCGTGLEFGPVRVVDDVQLPGWPDCAVTTTIVDRYFHEVRGETRATPVPWRATDESLTVA